MTDELRVVDEWVRAELAAARQVGVLDFTGVTPHPQRALVACAVSERESLEAEATSHVALVDLDSGVCHRLGLDAASSHSPAWSPDGRQLAVLAADGGVTTTLLLEVSGSPAEAEVVRRLPQVDGTVEQLAWSPDGTRLVLVVAQFGAEVSDVYGSGTVADPGASQTWRPVVSPAPDQGRRILHLWDPSDGTVRALCPELNVWEASWLGRDLVLGLTSRGSGEGAWYAAALHTITPDGRAELVHTPSRQLARPRGTASGARWSVLSGPASDRGLLAGAILVGGLDGQPVELDVGGVDVTDHQWLDEDRIVFTGLRGMTTVFGVADARRGTHEELRTGDVANGTHQPELGGLTADGRLVASLERHDQPPCLSIVDAEGVHPVVPTAGAGTAHVVARTGSTRPVTWTSTDGLLIEGLLTVPAGPGPHPLVVNVHGGPVAAWYDGWLGKDTYAAVLVARGFAVLRPNPRGSAGRGAAFVEAVIGDMGGLDTDDLVTGAQAMIDEGVTLAGSVGITGNSYGGYMAAWVPCWSEVFSAAASRSPVTDWRSQHLTGNLAEFDELFVGGDPFDPQSSYATRSPLIHHRRIRTPMLFTAGRHDLATPADQAVQLHRALLAAGVPTELAVYPEEGHGVRGAEALADQLARMIRWFETYLPATHTEE